MEVKHHWGPQPLCGRAATVRQTVCSVAARANKWRTLVLSPVNVTLPLRYNCWGMDLLVPDWNQPRPTTKDVLEMCRHIRLTTLEVPAQPFDKFVTMIRMERRNGGAYLNVFEGGPDPVFDWFASRNRLWDERLLDWLVCIRQLLRAFQNYAFPIPQEKAKGLVCSIRSYSMARSPVSYTTGVHILTQAEMD